MSSQNTSWKNYIASISAGVISICTFNSLDTLRVRWQVVDKSAYQSLHEYGKHILNTEGFMRGLQRPAMVSNAMAVGCSAGLRIGMYPLVREIFSGGKTNAKDVSASIMFGAGLSCGMLCESPALYHLFLRSTNSCNPLAYFLSTPLWSVKTRQQSEVALNPTCKPSSTFSMLSSDLKQRGIFPMWRGATPLMVRGGLLSAGQIGGCEF
jgi:hypothetical protein